MKYVECPDVWDGSGHGLFLAGGITGCADWQQDMALLLEDTDLTLINPRRYEFDVNDPSMEREQITWEHEHMERAHAIMFWFPPETLCPITLFELGKWCREDKPIFVACHPDYARRRDVVIQMSLARPWDPKVLAGLTDLAHVIRLYDAN